MKRSNRDTPILERRFYPADHMVIEEGDEGNFAYLIQSGSIKIFTQHEGREYQLGILKTGEIFGEMSLLFGAPRAAYARTLEDCNLILITKQALDEKLKKSDPTIQAIVKVLTQRLQSGNKKNAEHEQNLHEALNVVKTVYDKSLDHMTLEKRNDFKTMMEPLLDLVLKEYRDYMGNIKFDFTQEKEQ